jgi:hypothetical protein
MPSKLHIRFLISHGPELGFAIMFLCADAPPHGASKMLEEVARFINTQFSSLF